MNKAGNTIGNIAMTAVDFSPLWWTTMAGRTGAALYNGNYGDAATEVGLGLLAPYAVGKGLKYLGRGAKKVWNNYQLYKDLRIPDKIRRPIFEEVPIEEGYIYHTTDGFKPHPIHPYRKGADGKIRHYGEWTKGSLRKKDGKYVSVRPKHGDTDYIWWDTKGHNQGKEVYVTKLNDNATNVLQNLQQLDISQYAGRYTPTYYVTEPIDINKTIKFTRDPISGSYIPNVPGKVVTNKMTIPELFDVAPLEPQHNPKTSLAFFEKPLIIKKYKGGKINYINLYK